MYRINLIIAMLISSIFIISCQDEIILPKPCTEEPDLPFSSVYLHVYTDVASGCNITVDKKGHIWGDSIIVKRNDLIKNANVAGYICKDRNFYLNAFYNEPNADDRIKIEGHLEYNLCTGTISYCPNSNNNCEYISIGFFNVSYSGSEGKGSFYTPLFSGSIMASVQ